MFVYILRRLAATIPVMLIVAVFVFLMLRLTPADPAAIIAGDNANAEQVAAIRSKLGLDRSMPVQFAIWSGKLLMAAFGFNKPSSHLHGFSFAQDVIVVIAVHFRLQPLDAIPNACRPAEVHE